MADLPGPVVVGGLGGSGTRVVASVLQELGYFLGRDLNREKDHLGFTLLLKRRGRQQDREEVRAALRILERSMLGGADLDNRERAFLRRATLDVALAGHDHLHRGRGTWALARGWRLARTRPPEPDRFRGWGFKEPNTHLFVKELAAHFPDLRYVLVLRHGLDMAFSPNQTQLHLWGERFDVEPGEPGDERARAMLAYWVRATDRAIEDGTRALGERFLVLRYDDLCARPVEVLGELASFLEIEVPPDEIERLARLPVTPPSAGRYREHDVGMFAPELVERVRGLGFPV